MSRPKISTLILLRHGESIWNGAPETRFTGWCDVPLTVKGRVEAVGAGQLLRSRGFRAANIDVAFTSELQRAHETCELALASMAGHEQDTWSSERIRRDARLNERHYGAVQGLYKDDPELRAAYGDEEIRRWRRSMLARPPPLDETHPEWRPPPAPLTESLADCQRCEACKPTSHGLHAAVRLQALYRRDALPPNPYPHSLRPPSAGAWWSASRSASHRRSSTAATPRRAGGLGLDALTLTLSLPLPLPLPRTLARWTPQSTDRTAALPNEPPPPSPGAGRPHGAPWPLRPLVGRQGWGQGQGS